MLTVILFVASATASSADELSAPLARACNSQDTAIWAKAGKGDFASDLKHCALLCGGQNPCTGTCVSHRRGYSHACGQCFGGLSSCVVAHCVVAPGNCGGSPNGEACKTCTSKHCTPAFETCTGWTPPSAQRFVKFDPAVHNAMVHIDDEGDEYRREWAKTIPLVGALVASTCNQDVAAWRVHKHFDLEAGEAVLTTLRETQDGEPIFEVNVVPAAELGDAVPMNWKFENGRWMEMQYLALTGPSDFVASLRARVERLDTRKMSVAMDTLGIQLTRLGKTDVTGLGLRFADLAFEKEQILERTDEDKRTQNFTVFDPVVAATAEDAHEAPQTLAFFIAPESCTSRAPPCGAKVDSNLGHWCCGQGAAKVDSNLGHWCCGQGAKLDSIAKVDSKLGHWCCGQESSKKWETS